MVKVLVVGGGYAGFYTAWGLERRLKRDEAEVTVVDPRPYMTYQPFLPEVAAGSVEARHAAVSLRSHLHRTTCRRARSTRIDHAAPARRPCARRRRRPTLGYDVVVVTAGAVTRTLPVPGVAEHGHRAEARRGGGGHPGPAAGGLRPGVRCCRPGPNGSGC